MPSVDRQIRNALQLRLQAALDVALPCPDGEDPVPYGVVDVVPYQDGAYRPEDQVLVIVEVGAYRQEEVGGYPGGQRIYDRTYEVEIGVLSDAQRAVLAERLNVVGDRCRAALVDFTHLIPAGSITDLTHLGGTYHTERSEEGAAGVLALAYALLLTVTEDAPDVAGGAVDPTAMFP